MENTNLQNEELKVVEGEIVTSETVDAAEKPVVEPVINSTMPKPLTEQDLNFDAQKISNEITAKIGGSTEIVQLSNQVNIDDPNSIIYFGAETANEITKFADNILRTMDNNDIQGSGEMLKQLNKIMDKFDVEDFKDREPNFLEKIFNSGKNTIEHLLKKYDLMGNEVDKVYQQLKKYEKDINTSNVTLQQMFEKNVEYYEQLEKYILAGKMAIEKFKTQDLVALENKAHETGDDADALAVDNMRQAIDMLEQRVFDLELAKNVAMQSLPQIKLIQGGNYHLVRKINSAFIVTLPVFKQGLTQAIAIKRQAIQTKAMAALDEKTNELLLKNAQNTATQSKLAAKLAGTSAVNVETLEQTWNIIKNGIIETQQIQEEARQKRQEGEQKLLSIQEDFIKNAKIGNMQSK